MKISDLLEPKAMVTASFAVSFKSDSKAISR